MLPRFHIFYGWYILASSFAILFFNSGACYSFGVAFKPMIAEFDWSRGSISFAFFLNMTLLAISFIAVGRFYDRYGPKWVIIISTVFVSAGYALISLINSLWEFYIFYGVFAAIGLGGTSIPILAALISKWFKKWRGLAISLALSGNGSICSRSTFYIFYFKVWLENLVSIHWINNVLSQYDFGAPCD